MEKAPNQKKTYADLITNKKKRLAETSVVITPISPKPAPVPVPGPIALNFVSQLPIRPKFVEENKDKEKEEEILSGNTFFATHILDEIFLKRNYVEDLMELWKFSLNLIDFLSLVHLLPMDYPTVFCNI